MEGNTNFRFGDSRLLGIKDVKGLESICKEIMTETPLNLLKGTAIQVQEGKKKSRIPCKRRGIP